MIEVENFGLKLDNFEIFQNLNFDIKKDEMTIIVGLNGAGKTTLIKSLCGKTTGGMCSGTIKRNFGKHFYLPQKITYPNNLTLFEYISSIFYAKNFKWTLSTAEKGEITQALMDVELCDKIDLKLEKLSSGELQKANIAMALLSGAEILFLDEPTSNMDLINQIKILNILKNLKQKGITSVLILHDLNLASNYGDSFIGITPKRELVRASKTDFFEHNVLKSVFNLDFEVIKGEKTFFIQTFN